MMLARTLQRRGYDTETMEDGAEVCKRLEDGPESCDVLVVGAHTAHIAGLDLVNRVASLGFHGPIIVQGLSFSEADVEAYRAAGATMFVDKRCVVDVLLEAVDSAAMNGRS